MGPLRTMEHVKSVVYAMFILAGLLRSSSAGLNRKRYIFDKFGQDVKGFFADTFGQVNEKLSGPKEVCYPSLGCFRIDGPFETSFWKGGTVRMLPQSPEKVRTNFLLYTRRNPTVGESVNISSSVPTSRFSTKRKTKLIVHGYVEEGTVPWIRQMTAKLLEAGDYNVIAVDWSGGAKHAIYFQAAANARIVGAEMERLIRHLGAKTNKSKNKRYENFHIIGHSLGAHAAGFAGAKLKTLGRISGLDPARPSFENQPPEVRLDYSDALFVDVIHTDCSSWYEIMIGSGGFGTSQPSGHVDFYPNGGETQPGCNDPVGTFMDKIIDHNFAKASIEAVIGCDHSRAYQLFIDSIVSSCKMIAHPCSDYKKFEAGNCTDCGVVGCRELGFFANKMALPSGAKEVVYFLDTGRRAPFCQPDDVQIESPTEEQ